MQSWSKRGVWSLRHQWFISANVIFFSSVSDERRMQHPCCDRWWHVGCRTALSPATQQNMANSNLYSCRSVMPKNVLASLALQFSRCSAASYIANFSLKCRKIALAPLTADIQMCPVPPPAVYTPQSLESNQSDTAICAWVKESDYYTADSSSWIRARLTTVSSNHESLNQNKHLGSIIPCWKPLIVSSQSTLSKANALILNRTYSSSEPHSLWFICLVEIEASAHYYVVDSSNFKTPLDQKAWSVC